MVLWQHAKSTLYCVTVSWQLSKRVAFSLENALKSSSDVSSRAPSKHSALLHFPLVMSAQDRWSLSILSAVAPYLYYSKQKAKKAPKILLCLKVAYHDELKANCRK